MEFSDFIKIELEKAKGDDRSWAQYAKDADVASTSFTKLFYNTHCVTEKFLKKITSESAAPRNGVTFGSLIKTIKDFADNNPNIAVEQKLPRLFIDEGWGGCEDLRYILLSVIMSKFGLRKDVEYINSSDNSVIANYTVTGYSRDSFKNLILVYPSREVVRDPYTRLLPLMAMPVSCDCKYSLLIPTQQEYDFFLSVKGKIPYNGYLSIILVDGNNIVKEDYISCCAKDGEEDIRKFTESYRLI